MLSETPSPRRKYQRVGELIEISSEEDVEISSKEDIGLPKTSALVTTLLSVAIKQWRGAKPYVIPPFCIFPMKGSEIVSPRGIAFHPQLVDGCFASSHEMVEGNIRMILARRECPLFYIGSTVDLIYRWRDLRGQDGRPAGHAFAKNFRWHTMLVLYRTNNGNCCAQMEVALIKALHTYGHCRNVSMHALRVQKSSTANHWGYICLPQSELR